jgi:microcompartment protein CcmL/EutN
VSVASIQSVGVIEIGSWSVGMLVTDAACKAAPIKILQAELNDMLGVCVRFTGEVASIQTAIGVVDSISRECSVSAYTTVIGRVDDQTRSKLVQLPSEYNPLIEQQVVHTPEEPIIMSEVTYAIGFIETQGFTAVIEAVDAACKTANVEILGREKLGGGYISVVIKGDVAAVRTAIDAAKPRIEGLGKLIATHVIARPSVGVLSLLPKS